jgi:curved DNA-binding protein CbpA
MRTHYEDLHVTEDAPDEVIRAAYRSLSLKHHPDTSGDRPQSKWKMQRINDAYAVLADPGKRADYDAQLRRQRNPGPVPVPVPARTTRVARRLQPRASAEHSAHTIVAACRTRLALRCTVGTPPRRDHLACVVLWMMKRPWG